MIHPYINTSCMPNWGVLNWGVLNWGMLNWGMPNWGMLHWCMAQLTANPPRAQHLGGVTPARSVSDSCDICHAASP